MVNVNKAWWLHQMETFSALLALCAGNSPVTGEFPTQRPVTRSFDVFFDLRLNKLLSKRSKRRRFETPSRSLWRHCNGSSSRLCIRTSLPNFFINDFFFFNENCRLHNYADDISLDSSSENLEDTLFNLRHDGSRKMVCKPTLISFILCCFLPRLQNNNYAMAHLSCLKLR